MNDDVLCNRFITSLAKSTVETHAMSHRAKQVTHPPYNLGAAKFSQPIGGRISSFWA
jgi:hypothetical protein